MPASMKLPPTRKATDDCPDESLRLNPVASLKDSIGVATYQHVGLLRVVGGPFVNIGPDAATRAACQYSEYIVEPLPRVS
jgi:hypothetical protein